METSICSSPATRTQRYGGRISRKTPFKLRGESFRGKKLATVSLQAGKVAGVEPATAQE